MANSKGDARPRKIIDVTDPGKSAPSATSRPIIVTNRPMLTRDPMMAPTEEPEKGAEPGQPVSRVARTIKITDTDAIPAPEVQNLPATPSASTTEPSATQVETPPFDISVKTSKMKPIDNTYDGQDAASGADVKALAPKEESADNVSPEAQFPPAVPDVAVTPFGPSAAETMASSVEPTAAAVSLDPPSKEAPSATSPVPVEETEGHAAANGQSDGALAPIDAAAAESFSKPEASSPTPPAAADEPEPDTTNDTDQQLPASQTLEDEKRKQDEAAAQLLAEQEKIIASKRYYLPIKPRNRRRGLIRAVVALVLVLLLSLVWLDVVLDAGIVHIPGLQPITHFFR